MKELTPKHKLLIDFLADPDDGRTKEQKCEAAGFAGKYVYQLLGNSDFLSALHSRTTELVAAARAEIYRDLKKKSRAGDTRASEIYLKGAGDIGSGVNVQTNVTQNASDNSGFAERLRNRFAGRLVAAERNRTVPEDEQ